MLSTYFEGCLLPVRLNIPLRYPSFAAWNPLKTFGNRIDCLSLPYRNSEGFCKVSPSHRTTYPFQFDTNRIPNPTAPSSIFIYGFNRKLKISVEANDPDHGECAKDQHCHD